MGETGCPWTTQNCGANDEPFAFHPGGCGVVMLDGSVRFLNEDLSPYTLRKLVTRPEGASVDAELRKKSATGVASYNVNMLGSQ